MDWVQWVTIAAAGVGAVLGVVNTVWALWRDRVRLRIVPLWRHTLTRMADGQIAYKVSRYSTSVDANPDGQFGVRVENRSLMDITVESLGFTASPWWHRRIRRGRVIRRAIAGDADGVALLPCRLPARSSATFWCARVGDELPDSIRNGRRIYVTTGCGRELFATSALLRRLVRKSAGSR